MGADFMVYCCEDPIDYKRAMPLIKHRIESLSDNVVDSIADELLWYDANEIGEEFECSNDLKEEDLWKLDNLAAIKIRSMVREKIRDAACDLFSDSYRRDVVYGSIKITRTATTTLISVVILTKGPLSSSINVKS